MSEKFGIIITVENYQPSRYGLNNVKYANSDGQEIKKLFIEKFGIEEDKILTYQDSEFTLARFQTETRYYFKQLTADTVLFFYYAGHGFFLDGRNYLTTYETSTLDLKNTSVSFENIILEEFRNSKANTFVAFIDACAEGMSDNSRSLPMRGIRLRMEADEENRCGFNYAIFFACSPEEKSYSSDKLKHGVWTWHILKAFDINAYNRGIMPCKSTESLKKYLHDTVRVYATNHPDENIKPQTPYAIISANSEEAIFEVVDKKHTFEYWIEYYYEEFFNKCYLANLDYDVGYDAESVMDNIAVARDVCWSLSVRFDFPIEWEDVLNNMQYYASRIQKGKRIDIPYAEQIEILEDIECFVDSIPTFFDNE